ncbi:hypothetical protein DdX_08920 [Ditylenchus destructor]|uniref:Uncharacterized protein n=1 Tax=Ditylenchus destructor TaxID=166010 RepID=A0AAD4N792_9BILA|nr:hypothetical protein DdX_08920 [Ditylenchus destructor]
MNRQQYHSLYSRLLRDVFAFFKRQQLFWLCKACSRFKGVIDREFATRPPYLKLTKISYKNNEWKWVPKSGSIMQVPYRVRTLLPKTKFIRFKDSLFYCDNTLPPLDLLLMSHIWKGNSVTITWNQNFTPTAKFARSLSKCKSLNMTGAGGLSALRSLLSDNDGHVTVKDFAYKSMTVIFPCESLIDYLFQSVDKPVFDKGYKLTLCTMHPPSRKKFKEFLEAVKNRFELTTIELKFMLTWNVNTLLSQRPCLSFSVYNAKIKQTLNFECKNNGFTLRTGWWLFG